MRIVEMEATFGKLDGKKLCFGPGLSVIEAPNEWGKSTWCAFVTAMFYGVDTRERSSRGVIPVKEKYAPWSGKPMEGRMVLEQDGRRITIERKSGRTPMGEFRAYETESGLQVPGLTGETCGEVLLGVEKSVFCRSAFVRFSDLPVESDEALRRRLDALVTTGDESGQAQQLGSRLADLKRRIKFNKTGLLPQVQQEAASLRTQLSQLRGLQQREQELRQELEKGTRQQRLLQLHLDWLRYDESRDRLYRLEQVREEAQKLSREQQRLEDCCAEDAAPAELRAKLQQGYALHRQMEVPMELGSGSKTPARLLGAATVLGALAAVVLMTKQQLLAGLLVLMGAVLLGLAAVAVETRRRNTERRRSEQLSRHSDRREELENTLQKWQSQLEAVEKLHRVRAEAAHARQRLQDLESVGKPFPQPDEEDSLELSGRETEEQITRMKEALRLRQSQADQLRGQIEALPDGEGLRRQLEQAQQREKELLRYQLAIEYAQEALETASRELQRRFVPRITRRAEELLGRLTGGRYCRLSIGEDLSLASAADGEMTLRGSLWRSDGTSDQMYLALRLAVWETLCPEAPLILDDALVRFDEGRLGLAMELLEELGKKSQILVFTCRPVLPESDGKSRAL